MNSDVVILMVYASGVQKMLTVTLSALSRHTAGHPYSLRIITNQKDEDALEEVRSVFSGGSPQMRRGSIVSYDIGNPKSQSGQHGRLLDRAVRDLNEEDRFFLTMDSDCFPVADGWLKTLMDLQADDVAASGILWPWAPPPPDVKPETIEWKIRGSQNWVNTHPACQLVRTDLMCRNGWKFADPDGNDVNFGFLQKAKASGYRVVGLMPTRGPLVDPGLESVIDPEFNRMESLIFGDLIYHHVGATRECRGLMVDKAEFFKKARERVYNEAGAEWMLLPGNSHTFKLDREEEVARIRMESAYQTMVVYLQTNDRLFADNWA